MRALLARLRSLLAGLRAWLTRLFRRPPEPGRFEQGSKGALQGWLASAPLVVPSREYLVYLPSGHSRSRRAPVLVLCHGCRQSPEEFAAGTRITEAADRRGWIVLLPRQKESANPWRCWNWFDARTARGSGEAAILLAQLEAVTREHSGDAGRVIVAGMSAGGALAAAAALRHAAQVRGVFVHSGLACGAASAPAAAMKVMAHGPDTDVEVLARDVRREAARPPLLPLCVVHGAQDDVVVPANAAALVRQFHALNAHPALAREPAGTDADTHEATDTREMTAAARWPLPPPDAHAVERLGEREVTTREWRSEGRLCVRHVLVAGLGHAWSGGDAAYPYNDAAPPPATALLERFAADVGG